MFNKKKCGKCGAKVSNNFDYCPHCGKLLNAEFKEDFGMLGRNDSMKELDEFSKSMFGGFGGNMLNKMLGNALKMLEKEMAKEMQSQKGEMPKGNFQMFINGKKVNFGNGAVEKKPKNKIVPVKLPNNKLKNFAKLKKETPKTEIRRFSDKIVCEIDVPEVKSIDDVSINQLENSIEIKAVSKNRAYSKVIPINLPIINYSLENSKLFVELGVIG